MVAQDPVTGRFVKGQSGNPGGRKKDPLSVSELIDSAVTAEDWKKIINALKTRALRGDLKAIDMLLDRRFGKAKETVDLEGQMVFVWQSHKPQP